MQAVQPMVYILCGEDEYGIARRLRQLEAELDDGSLGLLNVIRLEGRSLSLAEVEAIISAVPLFSSKRLVVIHQPTAHMTAASVRSQFLELIAQTPPSTILVLVEPGSLDAQHWLVKWAHEHPDKASLRYFGVVKKEKMEKWIMECARMEGGQFTPQAAAYLASLVVDNTRLAHQEVVKLLTFVKFQRPVLPEDVESLTVSVAQESVFAMVDALARRDARRASAGLRRLLSEQEPSGIFAMIVRQFRMLIVAREMISRGQRVVDLAEYFHINDFVAEKVWSQARLYTAPQLATIYRLLCHLDDEVKTGGIEIDTALELFISQVIQPQMARSR